jgi:hypothetical protein
MARINEPIEPMTLGNMRANGVRSLDVCCWVCHHRAIMSADPWSDNVPVPTFGGRIARSEGGWTGHSSTETGLGASAAGAEHRDGGVVGEENL